MQCWEQLLLVANAAVMVGAPRMHGAIAQDEGTAWAAMAIVIIIAVLCGDGVLGVGRTA